MRIPVRTTRRATLPHTSERDRAFPRRSLAAIALIITLGIIFFRSRNLAARTSFASASRKSASRRGTVKAWVLLLLLPLLPPLPPRSRTARRMLPGGPLTFALWRKSGRPVVVPLHLLLLLFLLSSSPAPRLLRVVPFAPLTLQKRSHCARLDDQSIPVHAVARPPCTPPRSPRPPLHPSLPPACRPPPTLAPRPRRLCTSSTVCSRDPTGVNALLEQTITLAGALEKRGNLVADDERTRTNGRTDGRTRNNAAFAR